MALAGPVTLQTYLQNVNSPVAKKIWMSFIKEESVFSFFPIQTHDDLRKRDKRITGNLPTPTWTPIGQEPPQPFQTPVDDYEESMFLIRDNFDVDLVFLKSKGYVEGDLTKRQIEAYLRARSFALNNYFFNNNQIYASGPGIGDPNGFFGLKYRLTNPSYAGNNTAVNLAGSANLSNTGLGVSNAVNLEADFQMLFDRMGSKDGSGLHAFANPQMLRQMDKAIKYGGQQGGFKLTEDAFDRTIRTFMKMQIHSCGYLAPTVSGVQTTPCIDSTQDINGWSVGDPLYNPSGAVYSSIYVVDTTGGKFSTWNLFDPTMIKERVSGTRKIRILFDMSVGLWQPDTRSVGRLFGYATNGSAFD